jgi:hypothetical protein
MEQFGVISADHGGGKRRAGIALAGCTSASAFTLHRFYRDGIYTFSFADFDADIPKLFDSCAIVRAGRNVM